MVLKCGWLAATGLAVLAVSVLAWSGPSAAQPYRADEFLNLDLARAVLSPKPLGPTASFAPGPLDVTVDRGNNAAQAAAESGVEPKTEPKIESKSEPKPVTTAAVHVESKTETSTPLKTAASGVRAAHARAERSTAHAPRSLLALHQRNPVEAQARDARIQVWPCKSGGICSWKR